MKIYVNLLFLLIKPTVSEVIVVDCHPDPNPTETSCLSRGCIYNESTVPNQPWCYFDNAQNNFAGYDVNVSNINSQQTSFEGKLQRRNTPSLFGGDYNIINFNITVCSDVVRINVYHNDNLRKSHNYHSQFYSDLMAHCGTGDYQLNVSIQNAPFGITIMRTNGGNKIFDTSNIPGLTFAAQFLSITTKVPSQNVYGFGEQTHTTLRHTFNWNKWGMFARDEEPNGPDYNLYGVHPFYLCIENDGKSHGVYFSNIHAQHVQLAPYPTITYRSIGGSLDYYIFAGKTPEAVVQQYTRLIGFPLLPSYWSLGFHLCRYGYMSTNDVETVWKRNNQAGIPQDAQWIDINYMDAYLDFTYDTVHFANLPQFVDTLHSNNLKLVLITVRTDCAIGANPPVNYPTLTDGLTANVFVKDGRDPLVSIEGKVWPGNSFFPDFTNPNTTPWWTNQFIAFHNNLSYDGIWTDMNEPSNLVTGSVTGCANNTWNYPPFNPLEDQTLFAATLCTDSEQYLGLHYDLHSAYGFSESIATNTALSAVFPNKRPFILSRSTLPSSGKFAAHWTGDEQSRWNDMKWSIITIIEFNLFGIPFTGADICGFHSNTDEELCTRWQQLGAFYPFSRNHNDIHMRAQDPAVWSAQSVQSSKNALTIRYKFLPYLYTLFYYASVTGSAVMKPLFFQFHNDTNTYDIDDQFMWGDGFMIVPVLTTLTYTRPAYFPMGRWFDLNSGFEIPNEYQGRNTTLQITAYEIGLFVHGGRVLPWQVPAQTTVDSRKNDMGILIALDNHQRASGSLYWDDGISQDVAQFSLFTFNVTYQGNQFGKLIIDWINRTYVDIVVMDTVQVYGILNNPTTVSLNGVPIPSGQIAYNNNVLTLSYLKMNIFTASTPFQILWNLF